jgi:aquaporin Z
MNKYIVEFMGTFFLMLTVGMTAVTGAAGQFAGLAIGSVLMVMIFAGGHVSGGHYNPAVTLGAWVRGALPTKHVLPYMAAQVLAGFVAAVVATFLLNDVRVATMAIDITRAPLAELLYTFALVTVVLNTATAKGTAGNSFYGLAIGFTVMVGAYAVGPVSGGAFNPAVTLGAWMMGVFNLQTVLAYIGAQLGAAVIAGIVFKWTSEPRSEVAA